MGLGDKLQIGHYTLVGQEYTRRQRELPIGSRHFGRYRWQAAGAADPEHRQFKASNQGTTIVANDSTLVKTLYVIYEGKNPDTGHPIIKAFINPLVVWIWIGILVVVLGTAVALVPNAAAVRAPVSIGRRGWSRETGMRPTGVGK